MKQTPGKIYLADQRGHWQTSHLQRYSIFNFNDYYQAHKQPFGDLYLVNEEMLAGAQRVNFTLDQSAHVLLIPITGAVVLRSATPTPITLEPGQVQVITAPAGYSYSLVNPYPQNVIQFLHLRLQTTEQVNSAAFQQFSFHLDHPNTPLTEVIPKSAAKDGPAYAFSLSIGRFAGRQEVNYPIKNNQLFFAWVIAGAFEAEGRLLQEKDALALWNTREVELEALSNNALLLVLQLNNAGNLNFTT